MFDPHQAVRPAAPDGWSGIRLNHRRARAEPFLPPTARPWYRLRGLGLLDNHESGNELERTAYARACALRDSGSDGKELADAMLPHHRLERLKFTIASPLAMRVARDRIIAAALPMLEQRIAVEPLWFTTVIMPEWYFPIGHLASAAPASIGQALRQKILRLARRFPRHANGLAVGTIELSLRTDKFGQPAGWQVHLHFIADSKMNFILKQLRKTRFGEGPTYVRIPVMPVRVTPGSLARCVGYTFKFQVRRQEAACSKSTGNCGPAFPYELPADVAPEALLWLDRWELADLALVIGTTCLRSSLRMRW